MPASESFVCSSDHLVACISTSLSLDSIVCDCFCLWSRLAVYTNPPACLALLQRLQLRQQMLFPCHRQRSALQYSKFIKNGWTILATDADEWTLAAMRQADDNSIEMAVVSTNTGLFNVTADWSFGAIALPVNVEVYRTSATEDFARLGNIRLPTSGLLNYDLPPDTITTFHMTFNVVTVTDDDTVTDATIMVEKDEL